LIVFKECNKTITGLELQQTTTVFSEAHSAPLAGFSFMPRIGMSLAHQHLSAISVRVTA